MGANGVVVPISPHMPSFTRPSFPTVPERTMPQPAPAIPLKPAVLKLHRSGSLNPSVGTADSFASGRGRAEQGEEILGSSISARRYTL